jgi:hypothetical protein
MFQKQLKHGDIRFMTRSVKKLRDASLWLADLASSCTLPELVIPLRKQE